MVPSVCAATMPSRVRIGPSRRCRQRRFDVAHHEDASLHRQAHDRQQPDLDLGGERIAEEEQHPDAAHQLRGRASHLDASTKSVREHGRLVDVLVVIVADDVCNVKAERAELHTHGLAGNA